MDAQKLLTEAQVKAAIAIAADPLDKLALYERLTELMGKTLKTMTPAEKYAAKQERKEAQRNGTYTPRNQRDLTPEQKAARSEKLKAYWTPEKRAEMSQKQAGRAVTPEALANIQKAAADRNAKVAQYDALQAKIAQLEALIANGKVNVEETAGNTNDETVSKRGRNR